MQRPPASTPVDAATRGTAATDPTGVVVLVLAAAVATVVDGGDGSGGVRLQPSTAIDAPARRAPSVNRRLRTTGLIAADFRTALRALSRGGAKP